MSSLSRHIGCLVDQSRERQPRNVRNIVIGEAMAEFQHRGAPLKKYGPSIRIESDRDIHHD
ncbi:MAG: hypothetical protein WBC86_20465, partial [Pseudolabrys sp.]